MNVKHAEMCFWAIQHKITFQEHTYEFLPPHFLIFRTPLCKMLYNATRAPHSRKWLLFLVQTPTINEEMI